MTLSEALMLLWWANEGDVLDCAYHYMWLVEIDALKQRLRSGRGTPTRIGSLMLWIHRGTARSRRRDIERAMKEVDHA